MVEETNSILIFTPDSELKEYIQKLLRGEGYEIEEANQLEVLQEKLSQEKIELLLIDSIGSSTIDICKKVRSDFTLRHIPIIVIVEKENTIEKIKAIYAGADDYVEKPINAGELLTRIKANLWRANRDLDANPLTKLPILTISIGVVTNERRSLTHVGQIIQMATELKTYAKTFSKSLYIIDRRRG